MFVRAATDRADLATGRVEGDHRRRRRGPLPERVHAAAIQVRALVRHVVRSLPSQLLPQPGGLIRLAPTARRAARRAGRWPRAPGRGSNSAGRRNAGRGPAGGSPGRARSKSGVTGRRLPVGRAGHDQPLQRFHVPAGARRTRSPASRAARDASAARPASRSPPPSRPARVPKNSCQ